MFSGEMHIYSIRRYSLIGNAVLEYSMCSHSTPAILECFLRGGYVHTWHNIFHSTAGSAINSSPAKVISSFNNTKHGCDHIVLIHKH